jgi:hypothetical protein
MPLNFQDSTEDCANLLGMPLSPPRRDSIVFLSLRLGCSFQETKIYSRWTFLVKLWSIHSYLVMNREAWINEKLSPGGM